MKKNPVEICARYLHKQYLNATKRLSPESYNENAQKGFDDLSEEQKEIDRFIARKVLGSVKRDVEKRIWKIERYLKKHKRVNHAMAIDCDLMLDKIKEVFKR